MRKATSVKIKSYAKVNLALRLTSRRPDGYHNLSTVFQEIDLYDTLEFTPAEIYGFYSAHPDLAVGADNLCTRAYRRMEQIAPRLQPWQITLQKNIPIGAGLGGGSSNAAVVLKFLNKTWQINLNDANLIRLAREIGSDVPFYINGKTQGATGVGEVLVSLNLPQDFFILLVLPEINISTAWAYRQFNPQNAKPDYCFADLVRDGRIHWELFENQFEDIVFPVYPQLNQIKERIRQTDALYAGLSGSGSALFGIFKDRPSAQKAAGQLPECRTAIVAPLK